MNDITELAQSLKAAAIDAKELAIIARYSKGRAAAEKFYALANPANILALVEALEKAQQSKTAQREYYEGVIADVSKRIAELEIQLKAAENNEIDARCHIAELESRTVTAPQSDYFASLVAMARVSADKAMKKFPQPNYVLLKVAEEAGEVVQAGVHYAENRMEWKQVEGEIVQLLAMLIRLVTEGDQINGVTPPASCAAGIKVENE